MEDTSFSAPNCKTCKLKDRSVFKNCSSGKMGHIFSKMEYKTFKKGETIFKQGEPSKGLYCINEGLVKVTKKGNESIKEFILWLAKPGDMIGIDILPAGKHYPYTSMALEPGKACFIPMECLDEVLKNDMNVMLQLMIIISKRVDYLENKMLGLAQKNIRRRLAENLIALAQNMERVQRQSKAIILNYTVNDLAAILGTTNTYLYKVLSVFGEKRIVSIEGRKLKITNWDKLKTIAAGEDKYE